MFFLKLMTVASLAMAAWTASIQAQTEVYVDQNAPGANNGTSWYDAYLGLTDALDTAIPDTTIRVADGTYSPGTYYTDTFQLKNEVALEGGYSGWSASRNTALDSRNIRLYETILDGDMVSFHVVNGSGTDATAVVDGFTITRGRAAGASHYNSGGGMYNSYSSPTLTDCAFIENTANYGGAMRNTQLSSPSITNCIFSGNTANVEGGGIKTDSGNPVLTHCTIYGNAAPVGGGIYNLFSISPTVTNCTFRNNLPEDILNHPSSTPVVTYSCTKQIYEGEGNIAADPLFADPDNHDFHLTRFSPCINRGTNEGAAATDLDDEARPCMGTADMGADEFTDTHPLAAESFTLSQSLGGLIPFTLEAGAPQGGHGYCILGSRSGTAPGYNLPGGQATLPLNRDKFTDAVIRLLNTASFFNFLGWLDGQGASSAHLNIRPGRIPQGWVGKTMHYAYTLDNFVVASNPVAIEIIP